MNNDKLIEILSFTLPFANELANVLTTSKHPWFKSLYKPCVETFLIDESVKIKKDVLCNKKYLLNRMIVDLVALLGINMLIAKNSIKYGFYEGVTVGFMIIFLSFIFPNMFLHKILHFLEQRFKIKSSYGIILAGIIVIGVLVYIAYILENMIQKYFSDKK